MLIKVIYQDDKHDMVKPVMLDTLLFAHKIKQFLRSEGWVTVGVDTIRGKGGYYEGPERRRNDVTYLLHAE
jgi:hypothetical protein